MRKMDMGTETVIGGTREGIGGTDFIWPPGGVAPNGGWIEDSILITYTQI